MTALGVSYTRQGCSGAPASCMSFAGKVAQAAGVLRDTWTMMSVSIM